MPTEHNDPHALFESGLNPELVKNLEVITRLVREKVSVDPNADEAVAVVRVLSGVSPEAWEPFASTHGLESWLAIPLKGEVCDAVDKLVSRQERLAFQRDHDALTGIANRGYFNRRLEAEVTRAVRSRTELSLLYIDLDCFKNINDTHGHECGDIVLQRLGKYLQHSVRHYDTVARIGGEEFAILLPATSCWTGVMLENRLLEGFRKEVFSYNGNEFSMTFSGGVSSLALLDGDVKTGAQLLKSADAALYEAKNGGRNTITLAESARLSKDRVSLVQADEKQLLFFSLGSE